MGTRIGVKIGPVYVSDDAPGCGPGCLINGLIVLLLGGFSLSVFGVGVDHAAKGDWTGWIGIMIGLAMVAGVIWLLVAVNRFQKGAKHPFTRHPDDRDLSR